MGYVDTMRRLRLLKFLVKARLYSFRILSEIKVAVVSRLVATAVVFSTMG